LEKKKSRHESRFSGRSSGRAAILSSGFSFSVRYRRFSYDCDPGPTVGRNRIASISRHERDGTRVKCCLNVGPCKGRLKFIAASIRAALADLEIFIA
jgi:hypothetical protein